MKNLLRGLKIPIKKKIHKHTANNLCTERFHEHDFNACKPNETLCTAGQLANLREDLAKKKGWSF